MHLHYEPRYLYTGHQSRWLLSEKINGGRVTRDSPDITLAYYLFIFLELLLYVILYNYVIIFLFIFY